MTISPGTITNTVYDTAKAFEYVSLTRQGAQITLSGSLSLLVEYLEQEPSLWLRLLALKTEGNNGEAENRDG